MDKPKKEIEKNEAEVAIKVAYWTKLSYASIVLKEEEKNGDKKRSEGRGRAKGEWKRREEKAEQQKIQKWEKNNCHVMNRLGGIKESNINKYTIHLHTMDTCSLIV